MPNQALVVIDVQEGLFSNPNSPMYESESLLNNINQLIGKARKAKTPIIFVRHNSEGLSFESSSWQVHSELNHLQDDIYVEKQFCDSFRKTNLLEILEKRGIDQIIVCGLQTEYCVDTSCRSAFEKDVKVFLVEDAHSTCDNKTSSAKQIIDHHNESLGGVFVELVPTINVEF